LIVKKTLDRKPDITNFIWIMTTTGEIPSHYKKYPKTFNSVEATVAYCRREFGYVPAVIFRDEYGNYIFMTNPKYVLLYEEPKDSEQVQS